MTERYVLKDIFDAKERIAALEATVARLTHSYEMLLDDVARIGEALGVNVAARPESPKQVVEEIILAAKIAAGTVTLADVPEAPISDEMMQRAQEAIRRALDTERDEPPASGGATGGGK